MTDKQNILVDGVKAVKGYSLRDGQKVGAVRFVFNGNLYLSLTTLTIQNL